MQSSFLSLNDPLNLKGFILRITNYVKDNSENSLDQPRNAFAFLTMALDGIVGDSSKTEMSIQDFQKMLAGGIIPKRGLPVIAGIKCGAYDEQLRKNLYGIMRGIMKLRIESPEKVFSQLAGEASMRFFSADEICDLQNELQMQDYTGLLLRLLKHGFSTLENLPHFFAQRIYEEALTYDFDSPTRYALLRIAADSGHRFAALEYGNYANRTRHNEPIPEADRDAAFEYTLMALPMNSALWNLAYMLECVLLTQEQISTLKSAVQIDTKIKLMDCDHDELKAIQCNNSDPLVRESHYLAYKLCFYLAYSGFAKAFNSLGKYVDDQYDNRENARRMVDFIPSEKLRFRSGHELAMYYYQKGVLGGCVLSMTNMGSVWLKEYAAARVTGTECEVNVPYMLELMQISADAGLNRSKENLNAWHSRYDADQRT